MVPDMTLHTSLLQRIAMTQAEHQADLNQASKHFEEEHVSNTEKLQRVRALGMHLSHHKRHASSEHECSTCARPLDPVTELPAFLRKQVRTGHFATCNTNCSKEPLESRPREVISKVDGFWKSLPNICQVLDLVNTAHHSLGGIGSWSLGRTPFSGCLFCPIKYLY